MNARRPPRPRPPLDPQKLDELALRYVGRFATSRAKLRAYLARKVKERGWDGDAAPDFDAIADRFVSLGYVDDAAYALARSRSLSSRGYGMRRLNERLRTDGIDDEDAHAARSLAEEEAVEAALRFARRRRIGPFGNGATEPRDREKAIAAMVRAGHPFHLARLIARLDGGAEIDSEELRQQARLADI